MEGGDGGLVRRYLQEGYAGAADVGEGAEEVARQPVITIVPKLLLQPQIPRITLFGFAYRAGER